MQASQGRPSGLLIIFIVAVLIIGLPVAVLIINNRPPQISVPSNKMPHPNGWDDFVHAGKLLGVKRHLGPISSTRPISSWTLPQYQSFIKDNASALATLRRGLKKQYMHPAERSYTSNAFKNYAVFRELARTLAGEAKYYEFIGKPGKAADSLLDCIEFGIVIPRGGVHLTGTVGIAIENIGIQYLAPLLPRLSPADLNRVACRLEQIEHRRVHFYEVMIEASKVVAASQADILKNWDAKTALGMLESRHFPPSQGLPKRVSFVLTNKTAMIRQNQAYYQAAAREQRGVFTGKSRIILPANLFNTHALSAVRMRVPFAQAETKAELLRVDIALQRYKAEHGSYPAHLSQLAPTYLKKIPNDPFGGKPLRYKVISSGKSYLLYSIGKNFKDDSGNLTLDYLLNSTLSP